MERLQTSYWLTATDLLGFGKAPAWNVERPLRLKDEVELLAPVLDAMRSPVHLVGHSYGAAVALKVAQEYSHKIASVVVYEPVLFTLLFAGGQVQPAASEIFRVITAIRQDYASGDADRAVQRFIDYWSGEGSWSRFSSEQQAFMSSKVAMVLANFDALLSETNADILLQSLDMPVHCLYGENSPITTQAVARILAENCADITLKGLVGLGHMGPVTHSDFVNDQIEIILQDQQSGLFKSGYPQAA